MIERAFLSPYWSSCQEKRNAIRSARDGRPFFMLLLTSNSC